MIAAAVKGRLRRANDCYFSANQTKSELYSWSNSARAAGKMAEIKSVCVER